MALGGLMLKSTQSLLRLIQLLGSALILGIFSYFLAAQSRHDLVKPRAVKAVEGIAGAAVLWTLFALLLTCFVGGLAAFGALALILDLLFVGAFIAVTILTRRGRRACRNYITTPLGSGDTRTGITTTNPPNRNYSPNLKRTCRLEKAAFAVAIILLVLFLLTAIVQMLLVRHHKKEKRYGPSPSNDYTAGSGRGGLFGRKKANTRDAELATAGTTTNGTLASEKPHHHNIRPSHETGYTGSTVAQPAAVIDPGFNNGVTNKTVHGGVPVVPDPYATGVVGSQTAVRY